MAPLARTGLPARRCGVCSFTSLLLVVLSLCLSPSLARVLTVCPTDGAACNFTTIASAVAASQNLDQLLLVGSEVIFPSESIVNINSSVALTITAESSAVVEVARTDSTAWLNVYGNLTLEGNLTVRAAALYAAPGAVVKLTGQLTVSLINGIAVELGLGARLLQEGNLTVLATNHSLGVANIDGEWVQIGNYYASVNATSLDTVATRSVWGIAPIGIALIGSLWTQNGSVDVVTNNAGTLLFFATWRQNGPVRMDVSTLNSNQSAGAVTIAGAQWIQKSPVRITLDKTNGVRMVPFLYQLPSVWQQDAPISIDMSPTPTGLPELFYAININDSSVQWKQNEAINITLAADANLKAMTCPAISAWVATARGHLTVSPASAGDDLGGCVAVRPLSSSNTIQPVASDSAQPLLRFNATTNALQIVPRVPSDGDSKAETVGEAAVELGIASINEVAANGTYLRTGQALYGTWTALATNDLNASQAFVFTSPLSFESLSSLSSVKLRVFLFDEATNVSIGDVASFTVLPSFTKTSIDVSLWPWVSNTSRLEVRLRVSPGFTNASITTEADAPGDHGGVQATAAEAPLTSLMTLYGQRSSDGKRDVKTLVRFVSVVELDGVLKAPSSTNDSSSRPAVEFSADAETSSLVLSFAYFAQTMSYDPDLSVLVGQRNGNGGDDVAWIIAVSVAVPVAVVLAVVVVVVATVVMSARRRRRTNDLRKRLAAAAADNDDPL